MPDTSSPASDGRASPNVPDPGRDTLPLDRPVPTTLDEIRVPVEDDLDAFRSYFREAMRSDHMLLDKITQYVLWQKGKRIRPLLVLLSAQACGGAATDTTHRAAAGLCREQHQQGSDALALLPQHVLREIGRAHV